MGTRKLPSPCYVLDETALKKNLELLKHVQDEAQVKIILALKGFAMWGAFPIIRNYLEGATASSLHEAQLCMEEMKVRAHTYMVAYPEAEFEHVANLSSHLTFNSLSQWERFGGALPTGVSGGLRINPQWSDVTTALYNPASEDSRLGVGPKALLGGLPEGIEGLHLHVLCESDSYALEQVLENVEQKFGHLLPEIKWLNLGGGHLITHKEYEVEHLIRQLITFKKKYELEIILEPGSAVAWQAGDLHCRVLDVVESGGVQTAILDISFTCHLPDCLEMPYRPVISGARSKVSGNGHVYRMGGMSCLAGDYLELYEFDHPLNVGDEVIFEDMMHYTMVKTTFFNGINHPAIAIRKSDGTLKVLKEFDYSMYKNKLS